MIYFISDTHFFYKNFLKYNETPWKTIEDYHKYIKENWNKKIKKKDIIYILGDVCYKPTTESFDFLNQLNGRKHLILGNHDNDIFTFLNNNPKYQNTFKSIQSYKTLNLPYKGQVRKIVLSHYPIVFYENQHNDSILLYGHVHNTIEENIFRKICEEITKNTEIPMNCLNISGMMPYMDFLPQTLEDIILKANIYYKSLNKELCYGV